MHNQPTPSEFQIDHQCPCRFKPPWSAGRIPGRYVVKDTTGQSSWRHLGANKPT
jgi:hypothetical protein